MTRPDQTDAIDNSSPNPHAGPSRLRNFGRDEDGAMIVFGVMIFGMMLAIGGLSFDLMRYEAHRERLQTTLDRAVLAAASLTQTLTPEDVVMDYFAKAGMAEFISEGDITITEGVNSRKVEAKAHIYVPLHHGVFSIFSDGNGNGGDTLVAAAASTAEESIGNVEISLVLDVSGSMNSYSRLENLQIAAKGFVDTIYDNAEPDAVSTSIIPYATQVSAGSNLLSYFTNRTDSHEKSHCLNFASSDFDTAAISTGSAYEQTLHFDPWSNENGSFDLGESNPYLVCETPQSENARDILVWSTDKVELKDYIDDFDAGGNTSTDIGTKWGTALLDPSTQPILTGMIASGDVDVEMGGRPYSYDDSQSMKILVVMTDGAHTSQYYMGDFRNGDSFVWRYEVGGVIHYSIWYDGAGSAAITNPSGSYTYCDGPDWSNGTCGDWNTGSNPDFWFHAWNPNQNYNNYEWRSTPYGGDDAVQMTWDEVWAEMPPEYFSDEVLSQMGSLNSTDRNAYENAIDYVGSTTKNGRFDRICQVAKDNDVVIFTVGLEVTTANADRLEDCASTASHYYNVNNLDIAEAFASIAAAINQLRLTQ